MNTFPLARYRFDFIVQTPIRLPEYAGSMLRGAFGNALRRTACMTKEKNCKTCPLYRSCPYPAIFETPAPEQHELQKFNQIPNPYVIEPPEWGERVYMPGDILSFHMVLIGRATQHLALITFSWQRAFAHDVGHGKATLADVVLCKELDAANQNTYSIFDPKKHHLLDHDTLFSISHAITSNISLTFTTPLRLQDNGRVITSKNLTARDLLMAMVRRISLLLEFHTDIKAKRDFSQLAKLAEQVQFKHELNWLDWTRFSSRQNQTMQLGGAVGNWELRDVPSLFYEFLLLGQWLHIGKNATFGLGCYRLISPPRIGV